MRNLITILFILLLACNKAPKEKALDMHTNNSAKDEVKKAVMHSYEFVNSNNLADSLIFNQYKTFFSDSFVLGPSEGNALADKETILEEWRQLFKENKGRFNLTINRVEVSGDLAYVLYHYDEKLTNIESGDLFFEVTQSAIAILRKDADGNWKFEALRWN